MHTFSESCMSSKYSWCMFILIVNYKHKYVNYVLKLIRHIPVDLSVNAHIPSCRVSPVSNTFATYPSDFRDVMKTTVKSCTPTWKLAALTNKNSCFAFRTAPSYTPKHNFKTK